MIFYVLTTVVIHNQSLLSGARSRRLWEMSDQSNQKKRARPSDVETDNPNNATKRVFAPPFHQLIDNGIVGESTKDHLFIVPAGDDQARLSLNVDLSPIHKELVKGFKFDGLVIFHDKPIIEIEEAQDPDHELYTACKTYQLEIKSIELGPVSDTSSVKKENDAVDELQPSNAQVDLKLRVD